MYFTHIRVFVKIGQSYYFSRTTTCHQPQTSARNITPAFTAGPTPEASNDTPEKCFILFFDDKIMDGIMLVLKLWNMIREQLQFREQQQQRRGWCWGFLSLMAASGTPTCPLKKCGTLVSEHLCTVLLCLRVAFHSSLSVCNLMVLTHDGKNRPWTNVFPLEKRGTCSQTVICSHSCK